MLLSIRLRNGGLFASDFFGDRERLEQFWFGRGLTWIEGDSILRLSMTVDLPKIVAMTKRRDREDRFSVGFCDPYPYTASGLMALFVARLRSEFTGSDSCYFDCEFLYYPDRPHSEAIAKRLLAPLGYAVETEDGRLRFSGTRRAAEFFTELPVILLALDRRTRLFLSEEERTEISRGSARWVSVHPARRALESAIAGRPTPLRFLLPPGSDARGTREQPEEYEGPLLSSGRISTGLISQIRIDSAQRAHAINVFSRMNIDPRWLIYLPAGIASVQGPGGEELERPEAGISYFRDERIGHVVIEEKHMGSRGIVVLCRTSTVAMERFGIDAETPGCAYTRNGRRFFKDEDTEAVFLDRLGRVLERANFWKRFSTDWVCLDGEILPWSIKAAESSEESDLVEAGFSVLEEAIRTLGSDTALKRDWSNVLESELAALAGYDSMFKHYRTEVSNLAALKFAPFHLLAVEGRTFFDRTHLWHMHTLNRLAKSGNDFLSGTRFELVRTNDELKWAKAISWWEKLSGEYAEGLVIKPMPFVACGRRGIAQPALKFRSKEHLRLVYGPNYVSPGNLEDLKSREALLKRRNKHRRIIRQFALSMEAVERFTKRNSLDAVHECVLGVLAQEVAPMRSD